MKEDIAQTPNQSATGDGGTDESVSDFQVAETANRDVEFVGGAKEFEGDAPPRSPGQRGSNAEKLSLSIDDDLSPEAAIGAIPFEGTKKLPPQAAKTPASQFPPSPSDESLRKQGEGVKRLTKNEVSAIEKNLYTKGIVQDKEKAELLRKVNDHLHRGDAPVAPNGVVSNSASDQANRPQMAKKTKGIAFYYKNYVQIVGSIELHDHDELTINDRSFTLKKKRASNQLQWILGISALVVVLIVAASLFIKDTNSIGGRIAGVVLDEQSRPYVQGGVIRFPDLGQNVQVSSAGFFTSSELPRGTHKVQLIINNQLVAEDYATVGDDDLTMVAIRPNLGAEQKETTRPAISVTEQVSPEVVVGSEKPQPTPSSGEKRPATRSEYASVKLEANVPQARLTIDGEVVGAGNVVFSKLSPGDVAYQVTKDGYEPVSGRITLNAGQQERLMVTLEPVSQQAKEASYGEADYYASGVSAFEAGQYDRAIAEFDKAIEMKASFAKAYLARGKAYQARQASAHAHDDFLKAAEVFRFQNQGTEALNAFNMAVNADQKSIAAYLGRGDLYLARGEQIAALADFEQVIKLDKKSFGAYYGMGEARYRQGNYRKAIEHFRTARSLNEGSPTVHQYLVLCFLNTADYKSMKKSYNRFVELANEQELTEFSRDGSYSAVLAAVEREQ